MRFRKPSPAMLVASVALFVALGGSSYAALQLPKGAVGAKQLKNGAVTSKKVKDKSLLVRDFKMSQRSQLRGPQGVPGPTGNPGPAGRSALTPLQSGETVRGIVGGRFFAGGPGNLVAAVASFPVPAPVPLDNAHVVVDGSVDEPANECAGSPTNVTAPPGFVCIYPNVSVNAALGADAGNTGVTQTRTLGFQLDWTSLAGPDQTSVRAVWAYTAP